MRKRAKDVYFFHISSKYTQSARQENALLRITTAYFISNLDSHFTVLPNSLFKVYLKGTKLIETRQINNTSVHVRKTHYWTKHAFLTLNVLKSYQMVPQSINQYLVGPRSSIQLSAS